MQIKIVNKQKKAEKNKPLKILLPKPTSQVYIMRAIRLIILIIILGQAAGAQAVITQVQSRLTIDIKENKSALWSVELYEPLASQSAINEWNLNLKDKGNITKVKGRINENINNLLISSMNNSGRTMMARNFNITFDLVDSTPNAYGVMRFSFEWVNFARIEGSNIIIGDVFPESMAPSSRNVLVMNIPAGYDVVKASPGFDKREGNRLIWDGTTYRSYNKGEPSLVLSRKLIPLDSYLKNDSDITGDSYTAAIIIISIIVIVLIGIFILLSRKPKESTQKSFEKSSSVLPENITTEHMIEPEIIPNVTPRKEPDNIKSVPHIVVPKPLPVSSGNTIDVKSAFGYKGATIVYKIKIENNTAKPISDIKVYPYVPNVFLLKEKEMSISLIEPRSSQTVTFEIRPTGECGDCNVSARINYYDTVLMERKDIQLESKSLSIICPMLHRKEITEDTWRDIVSGFVKAEETTTDVPFDGEGLFGIISDILKDLNLFMLTPGINKSPQVFRGTARFYGEGVKGLRYAAQIEVVGGARKSKLILKAWAEKEDALTGFYHGVLDEIEKRVKVKEYIDDSIVQYNVHIGDKIGTLVKDSVVQRSTFGAGSRKCPNCGREVEANEKFCLECGTKL